MTHRRRNFPPLLSLFRLHFLYSYPIRNSQPVRNDDSKYHIFSLTPFSMTQHRMQVLCAILVLCLSFLLVEAKNSKKEATVASRPPSLPVFFPESPARTTTNTVTSTTKSAKKQSSTEATTTTTSTNSVFFPLEQTTTTTAVRGAAKSTKSAKKDEAPPTVTATDSVFFPLVETSTAEGPKSAKAPKSSKAQGTITGDLPLSVASLSCSFEPSGGATLSSFNAVDGTGTVSTGGTGNLNVGFNDGFTEMDYSLLISANVAAVTEVRLFCGLPGNTDGVPIIPLSFREPGSSSTSFLNGANLSTEVVCPDTETVINNVVSLYDAMRRELVYVQATTTDVSGNTALLRGQVLVATSPGKCAL